MAIPQAPLCANTLVVLPEALWFLASYSLVTVPVVNG